MALHEWTRTRPLDTEESGALLKLAMAGTERSAFRLWCRLVDMSELDPADLAGHAAPETLVELSDEIGLAMQVLDMAYRRLSVAYFCAVGPDDPPTSTTGLDPSRRRP